MANESGRPLTADEAAVLAAGGELQKSDPMPNSVAEANGGLSAKAPGKALEKGKKAMEGEEDEDEDEKYDKEGEKLMKQEKTCKSENPQDESTDDQAVSDDALIKAMDHMELIAQGMEAEPDRRAELAEKLSNGTLEKSEQEELVQLLGGEVQEEEQEVEDLQKSWSEPDELGSDYDVSPFLEKLGSNIATELQGVKDSFEKSMDGQRAFNVAMAKSFKGLATHIVKQGELIKSLTDENESLTGRLESVENTPLPRKGFSGAKPLQKSFEGEAQGDQLSRDEILGGLEKLMVKSRENEFRAPCGEPVDIAMARYENSGYITRGMITDVATILGKQINV